jgi:transglutaminase-like putative cysteine protease
MAHLHNFESEPMLLTLLHRTTFTYVGKAHDSFNEVRLRPVDDANQICRSFELKIDPATTIRDYVDFYGNTVHYFDVVNGHTSLMIEAVSEVETTPNASRPPIPVVPSTEEILGAEKELKSEFLSDSHYVPLAVEVWKEAQDALAAGRTDIWSDTKAICKHVFTTFAYKPRSTGVATLATDAIKLRTGVCQDFAHVALGMCRCSGIAARYVSGYFVQANRKDDEDEASHAWIETFIPGFGWAPFDPTHDRPADERYVKIASGRDYADIRPVSGTYRGGKTRALKVDVRIRRAAEVASAPA